MLSACLSRTTIISWKRIRGEGTAALIGLFRNLSLQDLENDTAPMCEIFLWNDVECRIDNYKPLRVYEEPLPEDYPARILKGGKSS